MRFKRLSVKNLCVLIGAGELFSMLVTAAVLYALTEDVLMLLGGAVLTVCALGWLFLLTFFFGKRLSVYTGDLCRILDSMISGNEEPKRRNDSETLFDRISHRLSRLYSIMQESSRQVSEERRELQMLVSDISHQVKTPVSNLKMLTDTLLSKPVTEGERMDFLQGIHLISAFVTRSICVRLTITERLTRKKRLSSSFFNSLSVIFTVKSSEAWIVT